MGSSRTRYILALLAMIAIVAAILYAPNLPTTLLTLTNQPASQPQNQTLPNVIPHIPEISQPASSVKMEISDFKSTFKPAKTSIKIGIVTTNLNSDLTSKYIVSALNQWAAEVNGNGGIFLKSEQKKIPVQIITKDDQGSPVLAKNFHEALALQDKADAVIVVGTPSSAATAIRVLEDNEVFHIVIVDVDKTVLSLSNNYTVFLGVGTQDNIGSDFGKLAKNLGVKSIAMVRALDDNSGNMSLTFKKSIESEQIPIVMDDRISQERLFFEDIVLKIVRLKPDALVVVATPAVETRFLAAVRDIGVSPPFIFTGLAGQSPGRLTATLGRDVDGLVGYASWVPSPEFVRRNINLGPDNNVLIRVAATNGMSPQAGYAYVAAKIIEKIMEDSGSVNAKEMRSAALKLNGANTALGPFFIGKEGLQYGNTQVVAQIRMARDGTVSYAIVWPTEYRSANVMYPFPGWASRR
ncbi:MAG: ABC transporter substrate-binding protein [Thaumarchaeota archaeon]|nr:ABC transporter substrate-binding protein [Nitrososphaerota archaeon]